MLFNTVSCYYSYNLLHCLLFTIALYFIYLLYTQGTYNTCNLAVTRCNPTADQRSSPHKQTDLIKMLKIQFPIKAGFLIIYIFLLQHEWSKCHGWLNDVTHHCDSTMRVSLKSDIACCYEFVVFVSHPLLNLHFICFYSANEEVPLVKEEINDRSRQNEGIQQFKQSLFGGQDRCYNYTVNYYKTLKKAQAFKCFIVPVNWNWRSVCCPKAALVLCPLYIHNASLYSITNWVNSNNSHCTWVIFSSDTTSVFFQVFIFLHQQLNTCFWLNN